MRPTLIYVGDPMCSWCYGFSPQLVAVHRALAGRVDWQVMVGGLRHATEPMNDELKDHLRHHWREVAEVAAVPFDYRLLDRDDFVYDTEPACRAVVAARLLRADLSLACFIALQQAFYGEGRDITERSTVIDVVRSKGVDPTAFAHTFDSDVARQATRHNFVTARNLGVRAFPTLLLQTDAGLWLVTRGYAEAQPVIASIEAKLTR